ncbi:MAG: aminotransferase class I/II-fold pyridoxal phosphate-dependent enzyme [Candidatus Sericytochromatia bacterium]|nr:aminotransferase class I/II-fold pyridoxal phosphate-dependent enzyme [Candidatus Sericytochromatia bacterium]
MIHPPIPFPLERWYARYETRTTHNLSGATVLPPRLDELPTPPPDLRLTYGYSHGHPALVDAIAAYHPGATPANVLVTHGSAEALYLLQRVLLTAGDRFVTPNPCYGALFLTGEEVGAQRIPWEVPWRDADPWESWDAALTHTPALVVVNSPHNPTGHTVSAADLERMAADVRRIGSRLIVDEVQRELQPDPPPPIFSMDPKAVSVGSFSKSFGLPGLRLGWIVADPAIIEACSALRDRTTICSSPLTEAIATAVLLEAPKWIARSWAMTAPNRALLEDWLADQPYLRGVVPEAGLTAFIRVWMQWPTLDLCDYLAETFGLLVAPGDYFGQPGFVRFGLGNDPNHFADGLTRLRSGLDAYIPRTR